MTKPVIEISNYPGIFLLEGTPVLRDGLVIFSPICPDYNFRKIVNPLGETERIHDFDGLGAGVGIVYEKLINAATHLLKDLDNMGIEYKHQLLVADVEVADRTILKKLGITPEVFLERCQKTTQMMNADLHKRGLGNSICRTMADYFLSSSYAFYENIEQIKKTIDQAGNFVKRVQEIRLPLHRFWFGISEAESYQRTIDEIAMYASFGHCPEIDRGVILCADSEILSQCYNVGKTEKSAVIYLKGNY